MTIKQIIESKSYTVPSFNWKTVKVVIDQEEEADYFTIEKILDLDGNDLTKRVNHLDNIQRTIWHGIPEKVFENCYTQLYWRIMRDIEYLNKVNNLRNKITNGIQTNISR